MTPEQEKAAKEGNYEEFKRLVLREKEVLTRLKEHDEGKTIDISGVEKMFPSLCKIEEPECESCQ